jgi:hypothetical protein
MVLGSATVQENWVHIPTVLEQATIPCRSGAMNTMYGGSFSGIVQHLYENPFPHILLDPNNDAKSTLLIECTTSTRYLYVVHVLVPVLYLYRYLSSYSVLLLRCSTDVYSTFDKDYSEYYVELIDLIDSIHSFDILN